MIKNANNSQFISWSETPSGKFELFSMSREALIAVIVWKFLKDHHLKIVSSKIIRLPAIYKIIKTNVKIDSSIPIKVSNWDLKGRLID